MKILFFVSRLEKPSTRLRIRAYTPFLTQDGIEYTLIEASRNRLDRLRGIIGASRFDICIIQKKLLSTIEIKLLKMLSRCLIFDFDDAIVYDDLGNLKLASKKQFDHVISHADGIIAGNTYLASLANSLCSNICIIPTPIDIQKYPVEERHLSQNPSIGWIGSPATAQYLSHEKNMLKRLVLQHHFSFKLISSEPLSLPFEYDFLKWSAEKEASFVQQFDIAISPLPDNAFTRGKCGYKIIQYQTAGVPTVASNVGFNHSLIQNGHTGFLAGNEVEWIEAILKLKNDPKLYTHIGRNARKQIEDIFDVRVTYNQWLTFITDTQKKKQ